MKPVSYNSQPEDWQRCLSSQMRAARWHTRRATVRWLCLRPPDQLTPEEQAALKRLFSEDTELATGYSLLQRFRKLMADQGVTGFE